MTQTKYNYRQLARFVIEAASPIAVGTGSKDFITDAPVLKDVNGLPYIPGSSIAGVIRHAIGEEKAKSFFGYNDRDKSENSIGSEIIFTHALMIGKEGYIIEGLNEIDFNDKDFYSKFKALPIRQHNSIDAKGTVKDSGKFDEQVVYKGTRFCFEIEKISTQEEDDDFKKVINTLYASDLRLGGGTRTGFGEIKVISCQYIVLNLANPEDLRKYIAKTSSLNDTFWKKVEPAKLVDNQETDKLKLDTYELTLEPDDFFLFGSGFGNDNADITPVKELVVAWDGNKPYFKNNYILIPATSVKGAVSHRVAYHYNRLSGVYADTIAKEEYKNHVGSKNTAVKALFGAEGDKPEEITRGNIILSDVLMSQDTIKEKVLNHVSIDRFTGGAIDGALFQEEVVFGKGNIFKLIFQVQKTTYPDKVIEAFEFALNDICIGMLPLGGGVNRGHGSFSGSISKNGKPLNLKVWTK
jgi:CRISPR/Cas system CSM-associated protein Csm3 (group 7 of RAMP superfamily)